MPTPKKATPNSFTPYGGQLHSDYHNILLEYLYPWGSYGVMENGARKILETRRPASQVGQLAYAMEKQQRDPGFSQEGERQDWHQGLFLTST